MQMASLAELNDEIVRSMSIGAVFSDFVGKINSLDFHRTSDLLVTASEDDSVRIYDIASAKLLKTTYHKKHGADRICFTHHPSSVICSSRYNLDSTGESLRYLSMYDNRCLRYFKGHKERVVSLCMSPVNDSFMSGSLDHSVRIWDLRVNACQRCGFSLDPSPNTTIEATFTPDGQYVVSGSGDGNLHAWSISTRNKVACWDSHIGVASCLKWAPRRVMFVAASSVLTFWIPNNSKTETADPEAGGQSEYVPQ